MDEFTEIANKLRQMIEIQIAGALKVPNPASGKLLLAMLAHQLQAHNAIAKSYISFALQQGECLTLRPTTPRPFETTFQVEVDATAAPVVVELPGSDTDLTTIIVRRAPGSRFPITIAPAPNWELKQQAYDHMWPRG